MSWVLASLGVYVRDTADITKVVLQLTFFMSPIVWPISTIENATAQFVVLLNPLAVAMEWSRSLIHGTPGPGAVWIAAFLTTTFLATACGYAFFRRTKDGFADVL